MIIVLSHFLGQIRIINDDNDDSQHLYSALYLLTHSKALAPPVTTHLPNKVSFEACYENIKYINLTESGRN